MRTRRAVIALTAATAVALGLVALVTPAQAGLTRPDDNTTALELDGDDSTTLGAILRAVEASGRVTLEAPDRAVVVNDTGTVLTAAQIEALMSGRDAGDVRLLATYDRIGPDTAVKDLADPGQSEPALKRVIRVGRVTIEVSIKCKWWPPSCKIVIVIRW